MTADPRRDQIARIIYETRYGEPWFEALDGAGRAGAMREAGAVVPILRAAVEQARAETAEAIAQAIEAASRSHDGQARPKSYQDLADIARRHGTRP